MEWRLTPRGERFPRWIRLTRRSEFQRVLSGGRRCVRRFLVVAVAPRPEPESPSRLGLTVSRKVGKAVQRNAVKRRLREIFRRRHAGLPPGQDFVLIARPGAAALSSKTFGREFDQCLKRLFPPPPGDRPPSSESPTPSSGDS